MKGVTLGAAFLIVVGTVSAALTLAYRAVFLDQPVKPLIADCGLVADLSLQRALRCPARTAHR